MLRQIGVKLSLWLSIMMGTSSIYAEVPLTIAVDNFSPPFIMRGANNQYYGFDIDIMSAVCKSINRQCIFKPMVFEKVLDAVASEQADMGLGAIIITTERSAIVDFSAPYLISNALFIGNKNKVKPQFSVEHIFDAPIGAQNGTVYPKVLASFGIEPTKITLFDQPEDMVEALQSGTISYALMDAPSAMYWQSQSSDTLIALGKPFSYGFGLAIAIKKNSGDLINQVNAAILKYQQSTDYQASYSRYLAFF